MVSESRPAPLWEPAPHILPSYEDEETREKLQMIRVKFLRLAHRLGQKTRSGVVAQVLHQLELSHNIRGKNGLFIGALELNQRASFMAEQLELHGEPLELSFTIMAIGRTGVGKSATLNSLFDDDEIEAEKLFQTNAFHMGTTKVENYMGTVHGIELRVIDTPGLLPGSGHESKRHNGKVLHSVKRFIKKTPPDVVLYVDRLDIRHNIDSDMPLLCTITEILGPSIWFNAIVVLTHAASVLSGSSFCSSTAPPSYYDSYCTQRSHIVQQAVRHASGDVRVKNPVALVENNHSACSIDCAGKRVLPNGQAWKSHLLLICFAPKILAEANALLKIQEVQPIRGVKLFAPPRVLRLPVLLSSLLQSRPQLKLLEEQLGDEEEESDSEAAASSFPLMLPLMLPAYVGSNNVQQMEISRSVRHGEKGKARLGFEMQRIGQDLAYTLRSETRFINNVRRNKAMTGIAGLSITLVGSALSAGVKVEDKFDVNERFRLVVAGGAMARRNGDVAYGATLEAQLRDKEELPTLGISVMHWGGKFDIGCNIKSQIPLLTKLVARANINNPGTGQVRIQLNNSEQLQIALLGFIRLASWLFLACSNSQK